jgi:ubiquitin-activating enzyme E1-like protein 2
MNPSMAIVSHALKVGTATEDTFDAGFFERVDCTLNALDNVHARTYTDRRSVTTERPLIDSGTTGTKGHVQVMVPHLTETWGATRDPPEEDIPFCTLKDFPSETSHTIIWASEQLKALFCEGDNGPARVNQVSLVCKVRGGWVGAGRG